ncbi:MAG: peptide-methionine (R)-S-oxide reductase MsrB, partial [Gammaproteobacteria bacterium]|nr:peptide-methionine (R)-S-oxide reductase MsrB [Gammaproteobacteria bacterium]
RDQFIKKHWSGKDDVDLTPDATEQGTNEAAVAEFWKDFVKPSDKELKKSLSPIQYKVTQKDGTERSFTGANWDNKDEGIYVDILSGEPLFSSTHKYKSGTGWPSFYDVIEPDTIIEKEDNSLFLGKRIELRSKYADSHLGHVFTDGPQPTGLRYCINGASMRFIPKEDMQQEGYGKYLSLFEG